MSAMSCLDNNGTIVDPGGIYLISIHAALDVTMLLSIILTNAFIIFSVLSSRLQSGTELYISRASSRFIVNLATADALVALSTLYYFSFRYLCVVRDILGHKIWTCLLRHFLICNSHMTSAYSMAAIAIDRYIAVVYALRYREIMNYRRSTALIVMPWLLSISSSSILFFWNNWSPTTECELETVLPFLYVCLVGMITHGGIITVVAWTHYRIHCEAQAISNRRRSRESGHGFCDSMETLSSRPINTKSARTVLLVTCCYVTFWAPYTVLYSVRMCGITHPVLEVCFNFAHTFANINYLVNPFIYSWRNASVKASIIRTFKRLGLFKKPAAVKLSTNSQRTVDNKVFPSLDIVSRDK